MKRSCVLFLGFSVAMSLAQSIPNASTRESARLVANYGNVPLAFEANRGQTDQQVKFLSRGAGYSLFLTPTEAVLALHPSATGEQPLRKPGFRSHAVGIGKIKSLGAVMRMKLLNANSQAGVSGQDELPGKSNYFIGNDPKKWHTNVPQFAKVRYGNVYPDMDLVFYGNQHELEYDFVLQPGANPDAIRLGIEGAKKLRLVHGDLVMTSAVDDVHLRVPRIYQEANGTRHEVRGRYVLTGKSEVGFRVGSYDRSRALVIDPVLAYSTYLGGSSGDSGQGIAVDSAGNSYVAGFTGSADFPAVNAIQPAYGGNSDAFVTKFSPDGNTIVYSTYLGGSGEDLGVGLAIDSSGNAYVCGVTISPDFPVVNAFQPVDHGQTEGFVTKINAEGTALVYSTFLGGSAGELAFGIAVDSAGDAYVAGHTSSADFPTVNAIQPTFGGSADAFVTKFKADGSALVYSTFLGGSDIDEAFSIALDTAGRAYVTGTTSSRDFPTANAIQPTFGGGLGDAYVTKFKADGSTLVYSTFLGGSDNDRGEAIAVDSSGNAYVTGSTQSPDFPTANAIQPVIGANGDAFVTKLNPTGSALIYSTFLGGNGFDDGRGIAVDSARNVYLSGTTSSSNFPVVNAFQPTIHGGNDVFISEIQAPGSAFVYSTYLGGKKDEIGRAIALDSEGSVYVTGTTSSPIFPVTPVGYQQLYKGKNDAFVAKIAQQTFVSVSPMKLVFKTTVLGTTSAAKEVTVTNQGAGTLTINQVYIGGLNPGDFAETNDCGSGLAAGASCTVSITFTPTGKNKREAGLGISSSDPGNPSAIALSGTGTVVSLSKKKVSFGDQPVGTTSTPQNVTLKNVGSTELNFTGITITGTNAGDFAQTNTCGTSIAAGASCTITVTFKPTAQGTRSAAVSINDDGGGSPQKVILSGTGT